MVCFSSDKRDFERRFNSLDAQLAHWEQDTAKSKETGAQERATFAVSFFEKYRAHMIREFVDSNAGEPDMSKIRGIRKATPEENRQVDTYKVVIRIIDKVFMRRGFEYRTLHEAPDGSRIDLAIAYKRDAVAMALMEEHTGAPDLTLDWHSDVGDLQIVHRWIDHELLKELKRELSKVGSVSDPTSGTMAVRFSRIKAKNYFKLQQQPDSSNAPTGKRAETMPTQAEAWHGNGKPPKTKAEKIRAVQAWDAINHDERTTLSDWLMDNFGTDAATGDLLVQESTFHGWRRRYLKK